MRYLKHISEARANDLYKKYGIEKYTMNNDGSIDVDDDVNLTDLRLTKIPLKFGKVSGSFHCDDNYKLYSLKGCPYHVGGGFFCTDTNLTSLEGCPDYVGGSFYCSYNGLVSLEGGPDRVGGSFYCNDNKLTSLEGFPTNLGGDFKCENNPVFQLWKLFEDKNKVDLFNDYDIVRGDTIVLDRLLDFLKEIDKPLLYGYKII